MELDLRPAEYVVLRLAADARVPAGLLDLTGFVSVTRTDAELSVVCPAEHAPPSDQVESGWRLFTVCGQLDFALTGIMADLSSALANAEVPLFAVSTYDTDHLLVHARHLDRAITALTSAGHHITAPTTPQ